MWNRLRLASLGLATLLFTACNVVGTRDLVSRGSSSSGPQFSCKSTAGEYALPITQAMLTVREDRNPNHPIAGLPNTATISPLKTFSVRDKRQTFCLDFLSSFTSVDEMTVKKDPISGLLQEINTKTEDQLPEAFAAFEDFVFETRATPGIVPTDPREHRNIFYPTRAEDLAILNDNLRTFGFCVIVEIHGRTEVSLEDQIKTKCGRRLSARELTVLAHRETESPTRFQVLPENYENSILYRPTITADIYILHQPNRNNSGKWVLFEKRVETLIDPDVIYGLDIRRAVFAKRDTKLTFDDGVMTEIFIDKGSEIAGFINIPLSVVRSIVRLPTEILRIRISRQESLAQLIAARSDLIIAQEALNEQRAKTVTAQQSFADSRARAGLLGLSTAELNQCVASCQAFGNDRTVCQTSCTCKATNCPDGNPACLISCGP